MNKFEYSVTFNNAPKGSVVGTITLPGRLAQFVGDIEFDTETGALTSVVITGKSKGISFLGRGEDIIVPWDKIEVIGNDSILISVEGYLPKQRRKKGVLNGLFYGD